MRTGPHISSNRVVVHAAMLYKSTLSLAPLPGTTPRPKIPHCNLHFPMILFLWIHISTTTFPSNSVLRSFTGTSITRLSFSRTSNLSFFELLCIIPATTFLQHLLSCLLRSSHANSKNENTRSNYHLSQHQSPLHFIFLLSPSTSTDHGLARFTVSQRLPISFITPYKMRLYYLCGISR
jgi:hypothetical protein